MIIPKTYSDIDGYEFEIALYKAKYIYPTPDNPLCNTIEKHAIQIYESEMLERSLCFLYDSLRPLTYVNVQKYFTGNIKSVLLEKTNPYTISKTKNSENHTKVISEYVYEFNDIFSTQTKNIIECKTYKSEAGRSRHLKKIRSQRDFNKCDYYLLALDNKDSFEMTDFVSLRNATSKFVRESFDEAI